MLTKAEKTSLFIIERVAPYFNTHGYTGTSLSAICKATGLTKGAIYGNFKDKEELAIKAFNYTVKKAIGSLSEQLDPTESGLSKLFRITDYYRNYYEHVYSFGGCPILNVGVDSMNHNEKLHKRAVQIIKRLNRAIQDDIEQGQKEGTIKLDIDTKDYASKIYSQIQGSIFLAVMMEDKKQIENMMDHIDYMIKNEMMI